MAAEFKLVFVEMGQGDCCMARCPDGEIVVIDCGSKANKYGDPDAEIVAQVMLRDKDWAGGRKNRVAVLILTHPDADHHNKVVSFFDETNILSDITVPSTGKVIKKSKIPKIKIDEIYFSNSYGDDSPLGNYGDGMLNLYIYSGHFETNWIYEITINNETDAKNKYKSWNKGSCFKTLAGTGPIKNKRFVIRSGRTEGKAWRVSIIAGNVPNGYKGIKDAASEENAKSLVTLFEIEEKKALLCGDMTFSTEKFLRDIHSDLLTSIDLAQIPHHGSAHASAKDTVTMLNPKAAVVSVGFIEHSHRLPRHDSVLERWVNEIGMRANIDLHDIDYWNNKNEKSKDITDADIQKKYNEWTKNGTDFSEVYRTNSKYFLCLAQPFPGVYGLYQLEKGGLFLYRERVISNLTMTSQKTQVYTLDENGVTYEDA